MHKIILSLLVLAMSVGIVFAQDDESANVRIAHLSADAGEVDIYINEGDTLVLQRTIDFGELSRWLEVEPGMYSVAIVPFEGELEDAILETEIELEEGEWITVAAIGEVEKETVTLQTLVEDYSPLDSFRSRLSVFHAVSNYEPINVIVNDVELIRYLGYPGFWGPDSDGFISFDILAQSSDIRLEQQDGTVAAELEDIVLGGNRHYFLALAGIPGDPVFVFVPADLEAVEAEEEE